MITENCVYFNLDMIKISLKRKLTEGERGKRNSGFQFGIHNLLNRNFPLLLQGFRGKTHHRALFLLEIYQVQLCNVAY